jgi:DNA-binding NtrC family response regulator
LALSAYNWPGNVRELRNLADYLAAAVVDPTVTPRHLPVALRGELPLPPEPTAAPPPSEVADNDPAARTFRPIAEELRELEQRRMAEALTAASGVRKIAAEAISMPLRTFTMKLRQYGLTDTGRAGTDDPAEPAE